MMNTGFFPLSAIGTVRCLPVVTVLATVALTAIPSAAQSSQPLRLVDAPTAGSLPGRSVRLETHLFDAGGVVQTMTAGVTDMLDVGCSYGGTGIVGADVVDWQPHVAAQVRVRIIEESLGTPGVALGFDAQGGGPYARGAGLDRFRTKSRGVYLVVSRNYSLFGDLGLHGGVNYSLETDDGDHDPSFWAGVDKNVLRIVDICAEYDFATNDNDDGTMTANRGYLNAALKWRLGGSFVLEFDLRNILRNSKRDITGVIDEEPQPSREFRFAYIARF